VPDTSEINIRRALPRDDFALGELMVQSFVETYACKMPEVVVTETRKTDLRSVASRRESCCVLVAESGDRIVGTLTLFPAGSAQSKSWRTDSAEIRYMAVDRKFHGKAISEKLLASCIEISKSWRVPFISLHVRRGAEGVARLYMKHGWKREPAGDKDQLPEIFLEAYLLPISETQ
jgi:GNAT superfamily N-acetyltransferase